MGLFGDLDVASASDDPFGVPDDTYAATITKVEVKETTGGKVDEHNQPQVGMTFTYKVVDESEYSGREITQYQRVPRPQGEPTAQEKTALSYLKRQLAALGVPESRMNTVETDDLVGLDVYVTTKKNGDYTNVTKVLLQSEANDEGVSFV